MTDLSLESLPATLRDVRTRPLFVAKLEVVPPVDVGATPLGERRVGFITGGRFEGPRLRGAVLGGGSDWQSKRADGAWTLDVRVLLRTDDGATISMTYTGLRHGPEAVIAALGRGEAVDPADYYFRTTPAFETASADYAWLNGVLAVGIGHRLADGPVYSVFELL